MTRINATPAKLNDGTWGARTPSGTQVGDVVTINTRAGKSWDAVVHRVVWTGEGVSICVTRATHQAGTDLSTHPHHPRSRGARTGCACGSREDAHGDLIDYASACAACRHDAS